MAVATPVDSCYASCSKNGSERGPCCVATRIGVSLELSRLSEELITDARPESDPVIIKKYANRRLYNTDSTSYITLEHLAAMTREGRDFKVIDAKSGDDITHNVLTQIIMEEIGRAHV